MTLYLITHATGSFEYDHRDMTEAGIVSDILDGQYDGLDEIYALDPAEGWSRNVTRDIARQVAGTAYADGIEVSWALQGWLQSKCGLAITDSLLCAA